MRPFSMSNPARAVFAPPPSDYIDVRVLGTSGTAELHAIPTGAKVVIFASNTDFYAKFGTSGVAAAMPSIDVTNGAGSEINPEARQIPDGVTHISLISGTPGAVVTMAFYGE